MDEVVLSEERRRELYRRIRSLIGTYGRRAVKAEVESQLASRRRPQPLAHNAYKNHGPARECEQCGVRCFGFDVYEGDGLVGMMCFDCADKAPDMRFHFGVGAGRPDDPETPLVVQLFNKVSPGNGSGFAKSDIREVQGALGSLIASRVEITEGVLDALAACDEKAFAESAGCWPCWQFGHISDVVGKYRNTGNEKE